MNTDYTYCIIKDECLHRRGCKRWIGSYSDDEVHELYTVKRFVSEISGEECVENDFNTLDRFRNSDGSGFEYD